MRQTRSTLALALALAACAPDTTTDPSVLDSGDTGIDARTPPGFLLSAITIAEDGRSTYVQFVDDLSGHIDLADAIEIPGNALFETQGDHAFVGLVDEPTWIKYGVDGDGVLVEDGRVSFAAYGWSAIDYGNTFVRDDLAVSVNTSQLQAIFWNPQDLSILGTLALPQLEEEGYGLEVSPVTSHGGLVYIPGRHVDWEQGLLKHQTMLVVVDPDARSVVRVMTDERCPVSGGPIFDADGNLYTMSDGRNYSIQMFARAAEAETIPVNCFLKQAAGADAFDDTWSYDVPELTGGHEALTTTWVADPGTGIAFAKMFYEDELPEEVEPVDFAFWGYPMGKIWVFDLNTTPPTASEVTGLPFSGIGFGAKKVGDQLMVGESADATGAQTSDVYVLDPETAEATKVFSMDGYFYGAAPVGGASL